MTASVSEISGESRRPAAGGGVCPVTSANGGPVLTGVVRCDPVARGPVGAPAVPAWKARPVPSSWPDATPVAQVSPAGDRPLLSVGDRQMPVPRARGGHGRRGSTALQRGGDSHKLNRRVRPAFHLALREPTIHGAEHRRVSHVRSPPSAEVPYVWIALPGCGIGQWCR